MLPGADSMVLPGDGLPSLGGALLRIALFMVAFGAAAAGWIWWQRRQRGLTRRIEVVDRALLARGVSVALLRVDSRQMLIGVSGDGVRMLRDMGDAAADENGDAEPSPADGATFSRVLTEITARARVRR